MKFIKDIAVAVLGPEGTFSEIAAKKFCTENGIKWNFVYCNEVDEIFEMVKSNAVHFGVVPLENSIEGSINLTIDCLREYYKNIGIDKDIILDVRLCLMAKEYLEHIGVICSHPHAIAQCRKFLRELNKKYGNMFKISTVKSTALACKMAKDDKSIAAIASEEASKIYGLNLLFKNINDYKSQTRFIVISKKNFLKYPGNSEVILNKANKINEKIKEISEQKNITSLTLTPIPAFSNNFENRSEIFKQSLKIATIFELENKPGALYEILKEFSEKGINLTKIESRPSKRKLGEYFFFLEFEGNLNEERIGLAINNLKDKVKFIEILGNY